MKRPTSPRRRSFIAFGRHTPAKPILPPVAIAAFDPSLSRYVTRRDSGSAHPRGRGPIVRSRDDRLRIDLRAPSAGRRSSIAVVISLVAVSSARLLASSACGAGSRGRAHVVPTWLAVLQSRRPDTWGRFPWSVEGPPANARGRVELLNFDGPEFDGNLFLPSQWYPHSKPMIVRAGSPEIVQSAARRIYERLTSYLLVGTGQSSGS